MAKNGQSTQSLIAEFADNSDFSHPDNVGLLKFLKHCFPDNFNQPFAEHHVLMAQLFFELYNPQRRSKIDRQAYFIIHREAAKSTLCSFGLPQYCIWMKGRRPIVRYDNDVVMLPPIDEKLIVVISETSSAAVNFVTDIKNEIESRRDLVELFGVQKNPQLIVTDDEYKAQKQWRQDGFLTADGTAVVARGAGQQIRGLKIRNSRPTLMLYDDLYSENNTVTVERREKVNRWFFASAMNSMDSTTGKALVVGTIVNDDTVMTKIRDSSQWFGLERPIIAYEELQHVLDTYCTESDGEITVPGYAECMEIQKSLSTLSWPERHPLYTILQIYKREFEQHRISYFYQEYLNMSIAPEERRLERSKLKPVQSFDIIYREGLQLVRFTYNGSVWYALPNFVLACDIASAESKTADDTVLAVCGYLRAKTPIHGTTNWHTKTFPVIVHIEGGKGWGSYDDTTKSFVKRQGIISAMERAISHIPIKAVYMEINGTQEQMYREATRYFRKKKIGTPIHKIINEIKKADRILSVMEPLWIKHDAILYKAEQARRIDTMYAQVVSLGKTQGHDDWIDAPAMAFERSHVNPQEFSLSSMLHDFWQDSHTAPMIPPKERRPPHTEGDKPSYDWVSA